MRFDPGASPEGEGRTKAALLHKPNERKGNKFAEAGDRGIYSCEIGRLGFIFLTALVSNLRLTVFRDEHGPSSRRIIHTA